MRYWNIAPTETLPLISAMLLDLVRLCQPRRSPQPAHPRETAASRRRKANSRERQVREMDSNFQYASTARWHRATDLPLPPTVKRRSAGRPPPMARPRSEAQRGSVRPAAATRSTHREMRCRRAGRPLSGREAPRHAVRPCEIRPGENLTLQYVSHDGRRPPAARAAATAPLPTAKSLPLRSADGIAGPGSILRPRRR